MIKIMTNIHYIRQKYPNVKILNLNLNN